MKLSNRFVLASTAAAMMLLQGCGAASFEPDFDNISGQVVVLVRDDANAAVPNAAVELWTTDAPPFLWASGATDVTGRVQLGAGGSVLTGDYLLKPVVPAGFGLATGQAASVPVLVEGKKTTTITIQLRRIP